MNAYQKIIFCICLTFFSLNINAQRTSDLGFRIALNDFSKYQLEYRKPFGEQWYFRLGGDYGKQYGQYDSQIISASDSIVVLRQKHFNSNFTQLRFGFQRDLSWKHFSFYFDGIFSYTTTNHMRWNNMSVQDSIGNWNLSTHGDNNGTYTNTTDYSSASYKFFGTGISFGLSYDFPISNRLIIGLTANINCLVRFGAGHAESNDLYNEFNNLNVSIIDYYQNAGVAIRYSLGKKE